MKKFKSHKIVHCDLKEITAKEWHEKNGRIIHSAIDKKAIGYEVVYDLGTADEYRSWTPKEKFISGYSEAL